MGRRPCCSKEGLNRGAWTALEDKILADYIKAHGEGKWRDIPRSAGLKRCGKSCRLRWLNYLRPDIKRGNITKDEEDLIIRMHKLLGNRWSLIAGRLPGRTDNEIKNYWNTNLSKKIESKQPRKQQQQQLDLGSTPGPAAVRVKPSRCTAALVVVPNQKDQFAANSASTVPAECALSDDKSTTSSAGFVCSEFDVGEISLAEILDSDHMATSFGDLDEYDRLDQPFLGLKEMMESGMDSDLRSLSFLLDSEAEDWLTEDLSIVDPS